MYKIHTQDLFSDTPDLKFEDLSKSDNMQCVCNICKEQSKPIYSHIEAKLDLLLEMMPKIIDLQDRIEHLENALTASDHKMERKISDLIDKKIEKEIFELEEKESRKNIIIMVNLSKSNKKKMKKEEKMNRIRLKRC